MVGESEDAFFNLESFKRNQVIKQCFRPPTLSQLYSDIEIENRQKKENEVRIIGVDFAFANTTSNQKNDNTIIYCVGLDWKKNKFKRKIEYIEGHEASDTLGAADRIRELFYDYNADYLVLD